MKPSVKRMVAKKYMEENKNTRTGRDWRTDEDMRDRRYGGQMYSPRYDGDMHHEEWPEDPYRMAMDPDRDPNMRRGRSSRTGRYISMEYDPRMGDEEMRMNPMYPRYDNQVPMPGYADTYRGTDMGFMTEDRYPRPIMPGMHHRDGYDFNVSGSIAEMGYGSASGKFVPMPLKMTRKMAEQWTEDMENADGSKGARWDYEEVKKAMEEKHIECDPNEMFAILNAVYSDYSTVAKKFGVDKLDFYLELAKAWIDDKDAVPNKATMYYKYVVKH